MMQRLEVLFERNLWPKPKPKANSLDTPNCEDFPQHKPIAMRSCNIVSPNMSSFLRYALVFVTLQPFSDQVSETLEHELAWIACIRSNLE
jgi:hypothetical protein